MLFLYECHLLFSTLQEETPFQVDKTLVYRQSFQVRMAIRKGNHHLKNLSHVHTASLNTRNPQLPAKVYVLTVLAVMVHTLKVMSLILHTRAVMAPRG